MFFVVLSTLFTPILIFMVLGFAAQKMGPWRENVVRLSKYVFLGLLVVTIGLLVFNATFYLFVQGYLDHAEENVAATAAFWHLGHPLYHSLGSANQYSLLYGPLPASLNSLFQYVPTDIFLSSKLPGVIALLAGLTLMWALAVSKNWEVYKRCLFLAVLSAVLIFYDDVSYWDRPDSFILFLSILALFEVEWDTSALRIATVTGVIGGLLFASKAHSPAALLPILIYYVESRRPKRIGTLIFVFMTVGFASAFLWFLLPNISFANYFSILQSIKHVGLRLRDFSRNVTMVLPFFILLIMSRFHKIRPLTFISLIGCCLVTAIIASKPGSGGPHMIPFLPTLLYFSGLLEEEQSVEQRVKIRIVAAACFLGVFWLVPHEEMDMLRFFARRKQTEHALTDLRMLEAKFPGPKSMGSTDDNHYWLMSLTPELVAHGGRFFVDSSALMEFDAAHVVLPKSTYQTLSNCEIPDFVLPSGGEPFTNLSLYTHKMLYPEAFRSAFNANYEKVETIGVFSLYRCRHQPQK